MFVGRPHEDNTLRAFRWILVGLGVVALVLTGAWVIDDLRHDDTVARNVWLADDLVGGLDADEVSVRISDPDDTDAMVLITTDIGTIETTAAALGARFDSETTVDAVMDAPSPGNPFSWIGRIASRYDVDPVIEFDEDTLNAAVAEFDLGLEAPVEPTLEITGGTVEVTPGSPGQALDVEALQDELSTHYDPDGIEITVPIVEVEAPEIDQRLIDEAETIAEASAGGIVINIALRQVEVDEDQLRSWLTIETTEDGSELAIDEDTAVAHLENQLPDPLLEGSDAQVVAPFGIPVIEDGEPDLVCCDEDLADKLLTALRNDDRDLVLDGVERDREHGVEWAEGLGIDELVGEFETFYTPGQSRVRNIERISELTRGVIIEPGETFSVNEFVGRRTREKGFVPAGVIYQGVFQDDVGGGISQYATTLFNAAFFAGLDFGEYQSHSIYISRYPYGREATLNYEHPDLQIVNTTPYGILLWPTTDADSITVRLYSTQWAIGDQTGQTSSAQGVACTKVTTERTRTYVDGSDPEVDTVTALYRPEGILCNGAPSVPNTTPPAPQPTAPPATAPPVPVPTTAAPPPSPSTTGNPQPPPDPATG